VLNDLFGIQARGGCSCAGPYGHRLLDIDDAAAEANAARAVAGWLGSKPGWTRISFSYYLTEAAFEYLVAAVHLVATHGSRLLSEYRLDPRSGLCRHIGPAAPDVRLTDLLNPAGRTDTGQRSDAVLTNHLRRATEILDAGVDGAGPRQRVGSTTR
jgi:hypothetical protein